MFIVIAFASLVSTASSLTFDNTGRYMLVAVVSGLVGGGLLWLAERFLQPLAQTCVGYILILSFGVASLTAIRYLTATQVTYEFFGDTANVIANYARYMAVALVILAILGLNSRRLQRQVDQTSQALDLVRNQAQALLVADETVRQQVAAALHDRVQAGLIGACMQIQSVLPRVKDPDADLLAKVIDSLEELRGLDVRRAVRSLSPNLREVDLQSALEELTETYRPSMQTTIDIDIDVDAVAHDARLGAYRIIEQSLMNSAMHGQARHCEVTIRELSGTLDVLIKDDGVGLPEKVGSGLGSTLIATWCRTLNGSWSRASTTSGGTLVQARLNGQP
jgi:signal transduction histidine kinase